MNRFQFGTRIKPLLLYPEHEDLVTAFNPLTDTGAVLARWYQSTASQLWLTSAKAANVAANNDPVGAWVGALGTASTDLVQATAGNRPVWMQNYFGTGKHAVSFNGVNAYLRTADSNAFGQPHTVALLYKHRTLTAGSTIFDRANNTTLTCRYYLNGANRTVNAGTALGMGTATTATAVAFLNFNGATSNMYIDNILAATGNAGTNGLLGLTLGCDRSTLNFADVAIGEMMVYTGALSAQDKYNVFYHLMRGVTTL